MLDTHIAVINKRQIYEESIEIIKEVRKAEYHVKEGSGAWQGKNVLFFL